MGFILKEELSFLTWDFIWKEGLLDGLIFTLSLLSVKCFRDSVGLGESTVCDLGQSEAPSALTSPFSLKKRAWEAWVGTGSARHCHPLTTDSFSLAQKTAGMGVWLGTCRGGREPGSPDSLGETLLGLPDHGRLLRDVEARLGQPDSFLCTNEDTTY